MRYVAEVMKPKASKCGFPVGTGVETIVMKSYGSVKK